MRTLASFAFFFLAAMVVYDIFALSWHFPFWSAFLLIPLAVAFFLPWGVDQVNKCCEPKEKGTAAHAH